MAQRHKKRINVLFEKLGSLYNALVSISQDDIETGDIFRVIEGLQILSEEGRKSLIINKAQEVLWQLFIEARAAGLPVRWIILKARRMGISTFVQALLFALVLLTPHRNAKIVAHDWPGTKAQFGITQMYWACLVPSLKSQRPLENENSMVLKWGHPHNSAISVATSNNANLGSGELIHYLHLSEIGKWEEPPADQAFLSVMQCVPKHEDTLVAIESTANGSYNLFHQLWLQAKREENGFTPVFLPWQSFPKYSLPPRNGLNLTMEQRAYQRKHNLTEGQMAWQTVTLNDQCKSDWSDFRQEYPATDDEAFRFSGMSWISREALDRLPANVKPPLFRGRLSFPGEERYVEFIEAEDGILSVWEKPDRGLRYVIGIDVGQGVGGDFTVIHVFVLPKLADQPARQVAHVRSNKISAADAGLFAIMLGLYYGNALIGVEDNNQGLAALQILERGANGVPQSTGGYGNLYYRTAWDQKLLRNTQKLGWHTSRPTKELLLGHLKSVMDNDGAVIRAESTAQELAAFSYDSRSNDWVCTKVDPETRLRHDDEVISLGIALQMVLHARIHTGIEVQDGGY